VVTLSRASLGTGRLQFLNEPNAIRVEHQDGVPIAVTWQRGRRLVVDVLERWRIDDEWWRNRPVSRLYFGVLLEGGKRLEIYKDLVDGQWYAQR
jgi:hypothetical protein